MAESSAPDIELHQHGGASVVGDAGTTLFKEGIDPAAIGGSTNDLGWVLPANTLSLINDDIGMLSSEANSTRSSSD